MNSRLRRVFFTGTIIVIPFLMLSTSRGDSVINGSFETGDLTAWTFSPAASGSDFYVGEPAYTGNNAAVFGGTTVGSYDVISQTLKNTAGSYTFAFYLTNEDSGPGADFQAFWDGRLLLDLTGNSAFGYTPYSFNLTGIGNDTITFRAYNQNSFFALDSASAVVTPEPNSLCLFGTGMVTLASVLARRRRSI